MATDSKECVDLGEGSVLPLVQSKVLLQERGPIHVWKAYLSDAGKKWLKRRIFPLLDGDQDKPVLLKFIRQVTPKHDAAFQAAMKMEIDILRDLPRSPLINRFLCCMKTKTSDDVYSYWMVSEYLDGPDMLQWLIEPKDYTVHLRNGPCIFWLAFLTLGVLHKHGIFHRDIKLENFILRKPSDIAGLPSWDALGMPREVQPPEPSAQVIPTLIDFGAACVWPSSRTKEPVMGACKQSKVGTPATADPWLADHKITNSYLLEMADYFSLAIVVCMFYTKTKLMWTCQLSDTLQKPMLSMTLLRAADGDPLLLANLPPPFKEIVVRTLALDDLKPTRNFFLPAVGSFYEATTDTEPFTVKPLDTSEVVARVQSSLQINVNKIYLDVSMVPRFRIQPRDMLELLGIGEEAKRVLFSFS